MNGKNISYDTCCCFEWNNCGPYTRPTPNIDEMFEASQLTENIQPHLTNLKIHKYYPIFVKTIVIN